MTITPPTITPLTEASALRYEARAYMAHRGNLLFLWLVDRALPTEELSMTPPTYTNVAVIIK
jgi:hypothetical protein